MENDIVLTNLSDGELLSLIFTNPFVIKKLQNAAVIEYNRRMKEQILKEGGKREQN